MIGRCIECGTETDDESEECPDCHWDAERAQLVRTERSHPRPCKACVWAFGPIEICPAHGEVEPCPTCSAYIAAGL